jgi:type I restriction-modification system DNA methylase subunit
MNKISEKKVEQKAYPLFLNFLEKMFKNYQIEDYYETADFPEYIKKRLENASKGENKNSIKKGIGKPDAIFTIKNDIKNYIFVFEAKSNNIDKATEEALHYTNYLEDLTHNLFRCSIDKDNIRIIHYKTKKELPIKNMVQLNGFLNNPTQFYIYLEQVGEIKKINNEEDSKEQLLSIIKNLNNSLREVGLSGQDRIDFASSLFLVKEIYDLVDDDFKNTYFSQIIHSKKLSTTLNQINNIATLEEIKNIFPDMSHLIVENQIINMEKFNKVIAKNNSENQTKASSAGTNLNERIKGLLTNKVLNLTKADFDFRGLIVEEFTHGNKGGGVSKEYGEFFTPRHIIKFIVKLSNLKKGNKIFDPAFGTGGFLIEAFKELVKLNNGNIDETLKKYSIYGSELHDWNVKAAKASLIALGDGHSNLINTDFIHGFNDWKIDKDPIIRNQELVPDVVLMNPPYSLGGNMSEWHFVKKCFDQLLKQSSIDKKERKLLVVLPYESIEKETTLLHQHSEYIDAFISLPYGVFQKYTDVRTEIIILNTTKKYHNIISGLMEPMFVAKIEYDGFTLDSFRRPTEENDLPLILEEYNTFQNIKKENRIYLENIDKLDELKIQSKINEEEYKNKRLDNELLFLNSYKEKYKNTIKSSLLSFNEIKKYNHFDKALWLLNSEAPTLGENNKLNKTIKDYFNIIEKNVSFSQEEYEDLPYIEIGGIELLTSFYSHSDKPKSLNKKTKEKGQITGGILAKKGDVLISMVRTYRGGFTVLKEDAIVSKAGFLVLRPNGNIEGIELLSMLKSELKTLIKYINYLGNGKTYPKMNKEDFVNIFINEEFSKQSKNIFYNELLSVINKMFNV